MSYLLLPYSFSVGPILQVLPTHPTADFLLAIWGCSVYFTIQSTCSLGQRPLGDLHDIPSIQSSLLPEQTAQFNKIPSPRDARAEQDREVFLQFKGDFQASDAQLKILRKRKRLKILITLHCFPKQLGPNKFKTYGLSF